MSGISWRERDLKLDERKSHSKADLEVVVQNHNQICDRRQLMHYSRAAVVVHARRSNKCNSEVRFKALI